MVDWTIGEVVSLAGGLILIADVILAIFYPLNPDTFVVKYGSIQHAIIVSTLFGFLISCFGLIIQYATHPERIRNL